MSAELRTPVSSPSLTVRRTEYTPALAYVWAPDTEPDPFCSVSDAGVVTPSPQSIIAECVSPGLRSVNAPPSCALPPSGVGVVGTLNDVITGARFASATRNGDN